LLLLLTLMEGRLQGHDLPTDGVGFSSRALQLLLRFRQLRDGLLVLSLHGLFARLDLQHHLADTLEFGPLPSHLLGELALHILRFGRRGLQLSPS